MSVTNSNSGGKPTRTLVCVTAQRQCERLIKAGSRIAGGGELSVAHVAPVDSPLLYGECNGGDAGALDFLYKTARAFGADMIVEHNNKPLDAITSLASRLGVECVVLGASTGGVPMPFGELLAMKLPGVKVHTEA